MPNPSGILDVERSSSPDSVDLPDVSQLIGAETRKSEQMDEGNGSDGVSYAGDGLEKMLEDEGVDTKMNCQQEPENTDIQRQASPRKSTSVVRYKSKMKSAKTGPVSGSSSQKSSTPAVKHTTKKRKRQGQDEAVAPTPSKSRRSDGAASTPPPSDRGPAPAPPNSGTQETVSLTPKPKPKKPVSSTSEQNSISASQPARLPSMMPIPLAGPDVPKPSTQLSTTKPNRALAKSSRSSTFWYLDGSVVVLVERTLYRLHRSRLTVNSTYFARLFGGANRQGDTGEGSDTDSDIVEVPNPRSGTLLEGEVIDSCPVYRVTGISAEDFECLLNAWDSGIALAHSKPPFLTIASLLRAAHTLGSEAVLSFASREFTDAWPAGLRKLEPSPTDDQQNFARETIKLARRCNIPSVLKRAFYELLRSPGFMQVDDNTNLMGDDEWAQDPQRALSYTDLLRLIRARGHLQHAWVKAAQPPIPSSLPCHLEAIPEVNLDEAQKPVRDGCRAARNKSATWWMEQVIQAPLFEQGLLDPFTAMEELYEVDWAELGFCAGCVNARTEQWEEEQVRLWDELDQWLGLALPKDG
ncbi:uncharacterized protein C8Q71DRAFT_138270 [Rhodofomes roseus]|uniref:BTB domain-containing protein n=1 Tax=Rhodofomes roseus TaxID=34475 RepID=A0ABQ8KC65_9APHY|nr:uncharacterized protein C8Q71DRAFT_138270 [Rhodofomes roseus]KAH9835033.1 hypothetical protein C8Q71DRAFT_138270 [Rhodofomes roseus]